MKHHLLTLLFVLAASISLAACETNRATGQQDFTLFLPESQEASVGAGEHTKIVKQFGIYEDAELNALVQDIGRRLEPLSERKDIDYTWTLLDTPDVNAFAVPGGYLYITRGLIAHANNEAEVAAVLAHEMAHVTARHSAQQMSSGMLANIGMAVLGAAVNLPQGSGQLIGLGTSAAMSSYSREHEREADALGIRYLNEAGYNVYAMSSFMETLQAQSNLQAKLAGKPNAPAFSFLSTHPATAERVAYTRDIAKTTVKQSNNPILGRDRYLRAVDGISYGKPNDKGVIQGRKFLHPQLNFQFEVPSGFAYENTDAAVFARNTEDKTTIIFTAQSVQKSGARSPSEAVQVAQKGFTSRVSNNDAIETLTINGKSAATAQLNLRTQEIGNASLRTVAVRFTPTTYYVFHFITPQTLYSRYDQVFRTVAMSLREMTAAEKAKIGHPRIQVVTVQAGDTIESLAAQFPFEDEYNVSRFLVLNGLEEGVRLRAGDRVKIVIEN